MDDDVKADLATLGEDYWIKMIDMLQQNWAVIHQRQDSTRVYFLDDLRRVFDWLDFPDGRSARTGLLTNGFRRFDPQGEGAFIARPSGDLRVSRRPIYSSGEYWD